MQCESVGESPKPQKSSTVKRETRFITERAVRICLLLLQTKIQQYMIFDQFNNMPYAPDDDTDDDDDYPQEDDDMDDYYEEKYENTNF